MLRFLGKGNDIIIRMCEKPSKVQCIYLAFKNVKVRSKIGQQCYESQKGTMSHIF